MLLLYKQWEFVNYSRGFSSLYDVGKFLQDQCATGSKILTELEPDNFGRKRNRNASLKKLTGLAGLIPFFLNLNTQLTSHKHKCGCFVL